MTSEDKRDVGGGFFLLFQYYFALVFGICVCVCLCAWTIRVEICVWFYSIVLLSCVII